MKLFYLKYTFHFFSNYADVFQFKFRLHILICHSVNLYR